MTRTKPFDRRGGAPILEDAGDRASSSDLRSGLFTLRPPAGERAALSSVASLASLLVEEAFALADAPLSLLEASNNPLRRDDERRAPQAISTAPKAITSPPPTRPMGRARAMEGRPIGEIFRVSGAADALSVESTHEKALTAALASMGRGLVVQGPSGAGKTTAVRRALARAGIAARWLNAGKPNEQRELDRLLEEGGVRGHVVIDDAHCLDHKRRKRVADLVISMASDEPPAAKLTLIGIPKPQKPILTARSNLTALMTKVEVSTIGRQPDAKVEEMIRSCEDAAGLSFTARREIAAAAQGSFQLARQLCLAAAELAGISEIPRAPREVTIPVGEAIDRVLVARRERMDPLLVDFAASDAPDDAPRGASLALLWLLSKSGASGARFDEVAAHAPELRGAMRRLSWSELAGREETRAIPGLRVGPESLSMDDPQIGFYLSHFTRIDTWQALAARAVLHHVTIDGERMSFEARRTPETGDFRDVQPYPFWLEAARRLHDLLVEVYQEPERRAEIAAEADIDPGSWDNTGAPTLVWRRILEAAAGQGRVRSLTERVLQDRSVRAIHDDILRLCPSLAAPPHER